MTNDQLKEVIVRNAKAKFHYQYSDKQGYVFYREDNKKAIRLQESHLFAMVEGEKLTLDFGKSGRGTFYVDWSIRDRKLQMEKDRVNQVEMAKERKIFEEKVNHEISDEDALTFVSYICKVYNKEMIMTIFHKELLYGVKHKDFSILESILGCARGWNDASKEYFTVLTGEALPKTKKEIILFLEIWCDVKEKVVVE